MRALVKFDPWAELEKLRGSAAKLANPAKDQPPLAGLAALATAPGRISHPEKAPIEAPADWREALGWIEGRNCPRAIAEDRWPGIVADARYLIGEWSFALAASGWSLGDIFSAHRSHPLARLDSAGVCLLLRGRKVGLVLGDRIAIQGSGGSVQHFRRMPGIAAETVLLWELEG